MVITVGGIRFIVSIEMKFIPDFHLNFSIMYIFLNGDFVCLQLHFIDRFNWNFIIARIKIGFKKIVKKNMASS